MTFKVMDLTVPVCLLEDRLENNYWKGTYENAYVIIIIMRIVDDIGINEKCIC